MRRRRASHLPAALVAVAAGLMVGGLLYVIPLLPTGHVARLKVTGEAGSDTVANVLVNSRPVGRFVLGPVAATHEIPIGTGIIEDVALRFYPSTGTRLHVTEFELSFDRRPVFGPIRGGQFVWFTRQGMRNAAIDETGFSATLSGAFGQQTLAYAATPTVLYPPGKVGSVQRWLGQAKNGTGRPWVFVVLFGVLGTLISVRRRRVLAVGVAVAVWLGAIGLYTVVPDLVHRGPSVAAVVGAAAYLGTPYLGQQIAAVLAFALVLVGAALLRVPYTRKNNNSQLAAGTPTTATTESSGARAAAAKTSEKTRGKLYLILGCAALALTLFPTIPVASIEPVGAGWDTQNFVTWAHFAESGLLPMRDFWFPYGGQWLGYLIVWGPLWMWAETTAFLAMAAWAIWRISGANLARTMAALVGMVVVVACLGMSWREIPAFLVPLTYAAIDPTLRSRMTRSHAVWGVACAIALFHEPNQLASGLFGVAFIVAWESLFRGCRPIVSTFVRECAVAATVLVIAVGCVLMVWLSMGTLEGNVDWLFGLKDAMARWANDQALEGALVGLSWTPSPTSILTALPFLLFAGALAQTLHGGDLQNIAAAKVLVAAIGPSVVQLYSSLAVGANGSTLLTIPLIALAMSAVLLWNRRHAFRAAVIGAFVGSLFAASEFGKSHGIVHYSSEVLNAPFRAVDSIISVSRGAEVVFARRHAALPERYPANSYPAWNERKLADALRALSGSPHPDFATLGDSQILYTWFNRKPPYHINMYDGSAIYDQERVVSELEKANTEYLVWRHDVEIGKVPYIVRNPIVFDYAIDRYVPALTRWGDPCPGPDPFCGSFDILKRRGPTEGVAARFWIQRLGRSMDLGFIPSYAAPAPDGPCRRVETCVPYATVRWTGAPSTNPPNGKVGLDLSGEGRTFQVMFGSRPTARRYTIRLDRLWFWKFLGDKPLVQTASPESGWSVTVSSGPNVDRLY